MKGNWGDRVYHEVDARVAEGKLPEAAEALQALLATAGDDEPGLAAAWMRLAGLRRALRQPRRALDAVHAALALTPLDFTALVLRASLLERLAPDEAGRAWHEALACRPDGPLPPPLAQAVAQGEARHAAWTAERAARLDSAIAPLCGGPAGVADDDDRAWRIRRLRDNVLKRTRPYRSTPTHFHYPGLTEREFHPAARFPWLERFNAATPAIRSEMEALLASGRAELLPYLQYDDHEALAQWRALNRNPDWTAIHLLRGGERIAANADACPQTMALLDSVQQPRIPGVSPNAMFSLLAPGTAIPPHVGVNNARLLCHVPLVVPKGCWFRVGAETRPWREGEAFVFDDTVEHEAANPSEHLRVVMIFDLWHPDLDPVERDAVAAIVASESRGGDL